MLHFHVRSCIKPHVTVKIKPDCFGDSRHHFFHFNKNNVN